MTSELHIWMGDAHVGVLDGRERRNLQLTYDAAWARSADATPLSVSLPLAEQVHSGKRVATYLWGLLPDNERVLNRWARDYECSPSDVFGLLCGVGADVAGAASYLPDGIVPAPTSSDDLQSITEQDVANLLRSLRTDGSSWHANARGRWSLAGAQAKVALAFNDASNAWAIPTGTSPTTHILKPAIDGLEHHDLNEHLCLSAARLLGMPAAVTAIHASFDSPKRSAANTAPPPSNPATGPASPSQRASTPTTSTPKFSPSPHAYPTPSRPPSRRAISRHH